MSLRSNPVGRHLPTSGGLKKTLDIAGELGCECFQIFVSNPQGWAGAVPREDGDTFRERAKSMGIGPVVVHAKYLINLASDNAELRQRSIKTLAAELRAAESIGAAFLVFHPGSHGNSGEKEGMARVMDGLSAAVDLSGVQETEPLIENSVGAGTQLCSTFESLAELATLAGVRVCIDTAHAYVAGHDLSGPEQVRCTVADLERTVGLERVALIHLNDPAYSLGSRRDGHRRIGEGQLPLLSWRELFTAVPRVPLIMETPYSTPEVNAAQIELVKDLAGGTQAAL